MAEAAFQACDVNLCRGYYAAALRGSITKEQQAALPFLYQDMARSLVVLSGNRAEAAGLFARGRTLYLETRPAGERDQWRRRWEAEPLPAWWPERAGKA
jgi:hypothetical protein